MIASSLGSNLHGLWMRDGALSDADAKHLTTALRVSNLRMRVLRSPSPR